MVVSVANLPSCPTAARALFEGLDQELWDVAPAGDVFFSVESRPQPQLRLILNWHQELKRLVPVD